MRTDARVTTNPSLAPIMPVLLRMARETIRETTRVASMAAMGKTVIRDADPHKNRVDHRTRGDSKETPITSVTLSLIHI